MPPKKKQSGEEPEVKDERRLINKGETKKDFTASRESELVATRKSARQRAVQSHRRRDQAADMDMDMKPINRFSEIAAVKKNRLKQLEQQKGLSDNQRE